MGIPIIRVIQQLLLKIFLKRKNRPKQNEYVENKRDKKRKKMSKNQEFADFEWMIEEGADEKLQREVEEQLKFAELERMMMQEEQEAGDLQMLEKMQQMTTNSGQSGSQYVAQIPKQQLNVNAAVFVPSWLQKA